MPFCFKTPYQFTPLLHSWSLIFCLTHIVWMHTRTLVDSISLTAHSETGGASCSLKSLSVNVCLLFTSVHVRNLFLCKFLCSYVDINHKAQLSSSCTCIMYGLMQNVLAQEAIIRPIGHWRDYYERCIIMFYFLLCLMHCIWHNFLD
jgi:hypothetical protein